MHSISFESADQGPIEFCLKRSVKVVCNLFSKETYSYSTYLRKNSFIFFETVSLDNLDNKCLILVYGQKISVTK